MRGNKGGLSRRSIATAACHLLLYADADAEALRR